MPAVVASVLATWLLAVPPPAAEPPVRKAPDRQLSFEAEAFGRQLIELAERVSTEYVQPVPAHELYLAGLAELYDTAGLKFPEEIRKDILQANGYADSLRVITNARVALGRRDELSGWRAFVIAVNGFSRATDPYCALSWQKSSSAAASDADFGMGFELEGATGGRWVAFQLDSGPAAPIMTPNGTQPAEPPVGPKWIVKRVIPGSPAASAGLRPGDVVTHLNELEVTADSNARLFRRLASFSNPDLADGQTIDASKPVNLRVKREGALAPLDIAISRLGYNPESIFGVMKRADGAWNFMLDRDAKIGYIRLGSVETPAAATFALAMHSLANEGATGLILDLRWCPGGYVDPTAGICGLLLKESVTIGTVKYRHPDRNFQSTFTAAAGQGVPTYESIPLAVLVGCDTIGGGEMIAAALQDHKRGIVVGQRTFGKANLMNIVNTSIPGLTYRISTGYSFRPNGKARHRFPDSALSDDWGVRPDRGYEFSTTPDYSAKMRLQAERQAIRPPGDLGIVPFDDPLEDPQKLLAVKFLKEMIAKK